MGEEGHNRFLLGDNPGKTEGRGAAWQGMGKTRLERYCTSDFRELTTA